MDVRGSVLRSRARVVLAVCGASLLLGGCEQWDAASKIRSGEWEIVKKEELAQLRRDAELNRAVGRFREFHAGTNTWRLDTATGANCLMLASDVEWKKPDVASQGCAP